MSLFDKKMYVISVPGLGWWCGGDQWTKHDFEKVVLFHHEEAAHHQAKVMHFEDYKVICRDLQIVELCTSKITK